LSPLDGYPVDDENGEGVPRRLTDEQIEQLLAGRTPEGLSSLGNVADVVAQLASASASEIPDQLASDHITRAAAVAGSAPDAIPAAAAASPNRSRRLLRRFALSGLFSSLAAKMVLGTAVALAATAGAAAAGILPDPIQSVAADAAEIIGIDIPDPDDNTLGTLPPDSDVGEGGPQSDEPTSTSDGADGSSDPSDEPAKSDSDDDNASDDEDIEQVAPLVALVGTHDWVGTACDGTSLTVTYDIAEDGSVLASNTSPDAQISETSHGFRVTFSATVVDVELQESGGDWRLRIRADESCEDDDDSDDDDSDDDDSDDDDSDDDDSG